MKTYLYVVMILTVLLTISFADTYQTWPIKDLRINRLDLGEGTANCYVVRSENREAFVIDPGGNAIKVEEFVKSEHLKVLGYLVTHGHNDHIRGLPQLIAQMPASAGIHSDDIPLYKKRMGNSGRFDLFFKDAEDYRNNALSFTIIHTPGHSPGSVCIYFKQAGVAFTGDTLFADGVGRTDLDGGNEIALRASLKKLSALPSQTVLFPGHGPETTIQQLRQQNPYMR